VHSTKRCQLLLAVLVSVAVASPAAATSIIIDPSSQDTFILEDSPNALKGTTARIKARSRAAKRWRGLVQFDLSSIPQFSTITSATLRLYEVAPPGVAKTHGVHLVTDPWLQSTAKWSNQPAHAASATATTAVGTSKGERTFAVTSDVQIWADDPPTNHGWMVIDQAEGDTNWDIVKYVARETRDNATHKPKLDVDFAAPACATNADCADANPCTVNERCQAGHCAVDPRNCEEQPADLCTDDICDPGQPQGQECVHSSKCDDGFSCTADTCNPGNGACTNTPVDSNCTAQGCKVGTCVADPDRTDLDEAGCLITEVKPDDWPCNPDSDQCTDDKCLAGQCTHPFSVLGTPCTPDGNPCTDDVCDGADTCGVNNTEPCSDDDACTDGDQCSAGACVPGGPLDCDDHNVCTDEVCNPASGCVYTNTTGPCTDDDACTTGDACSAGACVPSGSLECSDGNICTDDDCSPASGCVYTNNTGPCTDNDVCTVGDQCSGGTCVTSGSLNCDDGQICTDDDCNPASGCFYSNNTALCSDGNACTDVDQCSGGACVPGGPPDCDDHDVCTDDTCEPSSGCVYGYNTAPCDDGNSCTIADQCTGGVCSGDPETCGDGTVQAACGEECDDGVAGGRNCTAQCRFICWPAPQLGCRKPVASKKAVIVVKDKSPNDKDALVWTWNKGTATLLGDFGTPLAATGFTLCLYDQSANPQPLIFVKAPPGGMCGTKPCWRATKTGYKYTDKLLDPDGVSVIMLKAGADSTAKIVVKGKGANLAMPMLPLTPKVTVQLKRDDLGTCWDAEYSTPIKNQSDQFKAMGD
jgi:hypothetical protein